jgi:hypothetical protein
MTTYEHRLRKLLEGYPVRIQLVDQIQLTAAGKHRTVTSDVKVDALATAVRSDSLLWPVS